MPGVPPLGCVAILSKSFRNYLLNSGKTVHEGCMGHSAGCRDFSILDHGKMNPVSFLNMSDPDREPCYIPKTLPVFNFDNAWHWTLHRCSKLLGNSMLSLWVDDAESGYCCISAVRGVQILAAPLDWHEVVVPRMATEMEVRICRMGLDNRRTKRDNLFRVANRPIIPINNQPMNNQ